MVFLPTKFLSLPKDKHSVPSPAAPVIWKSHSVCLHLINSGSHFKSHLEISSLLPCSSMTVFCDLTSISIRLVQSLNSVDTPNQRVIISDESASSTKGRRLSKLPSWPHPPSPSICSISQPWEGYLPMTVFLLG